MGDLTHAGAVGVEGPSAPRKSSWDRLGRARVDGVGFGLQVRGGVTLAEIGAVGLWTRECEGRLA